MIELRDRKGTIGVLSVYKRIVFGKNQKNGLPVPFISRIVFIRRNEFM